MATAVDWGADTHTHWGYNAEPRYLGHYHDATQGHRDFVAYLRGYLFWLDWQHEPRPGEALPHL